MLQLRKLSAPVWACMIVFALAAPALARADDCTTSCHVEMTNKRFVHGGVQMGCIKCHSELDASATPHKPKGRIAKGLRADGPALCEACHDAKLFNGRLVHAPVASGQCSSCHDPHGSDHAGLAPRPPAELCLDCHPDVKKRPHLIVGFSGGGHPLGDAKKEVADPTRDGKPFYCVACHEPHRGDLPRLSKYERGIAGCRACHKI